ncbi:MAG: FliM/FliN family flagellar motor switch protein [Thermoguttaceae bacterium]|nr:FliM/FliN family flagellar motor switch protein [Thermoguttaceae bacterium]
MKHSSLTPDEINALLEDVETPCPELPDFEVPDQTEKNAGNEERRTFSREQIASLGNLELEVRIELGQTTMLLSEVAKLKPGSVVILDKHVNDLVNVLVNGKAVARGELLIVDGCFSVRITEFL